MPPVILHDHLNKKRRHAVPTGLPAREAVEGGAPTGSWREATEEWNKLKSLFLGKSWI